jgi:hypothetical protein
MAAREAIMYEQELVDRDDICPHGIGMKEFCETCQRRIFYARQDRNPDGTKKQTWLDDVLTQVKAENKKEAGR